MDQGYSENSNPLPAKNTGKQTEILPMLALDYTKRAHDITFPCFGQPKLDGVRAITYGCSIYSRKGKEFTILDAITQELKEHRKLHLDGELFSKDLTFQEISGLVRKQKISTEELSKLAKIKFIVYDLV